MFPYNEYLQLAKRWANASDEASLRCAVSRAYYACFHLVKEHGEQNGERFFNDKNIHVAVKKYLLNNTNPEIQLLGAKQSRLRKSRNKCDYNKTIRGMNREVQKAIQEADSIFSVIKI